MRNLLRVSAKSSPHVELATRIATRLGRVVYIITVDGFEARFLMPRGVAQGDARGPLLFLILYHYFGKDLALESPA